jgi:hypothetical protein
MKKKIAAVARPEIEMFFLGAIDYGDFDRPRHPHTPAYSLGWEYKARVSRERAAHPKIFRDAKAHPTLP